MLLQTVAKSTNKLITGCLNSCRMYLWDTICACQQSLATPRQNLNAKLIMTKLTASFAAPPHATTPPAITADVVSQNILISIK